jgi:blocked-early-in-transport protein 1
VGGPTDSAAFQRAQYRGAGASPASVGSSMDQRHSPEVEATATEAENNAILEALLANVRTMKKGVTAVNHEVKSHLSLLDQLASTTQFANDRVKTTGRKLQEVSGLSSAWHVWLLFLVAFVVFAYLVLLIKWRGFA